MGYICSTVVPFYSVLYSALILISFGIIAVFRKLYVYDSVLMDCIKLRFFNPPALLWVAVHVEYNRQCSIVTVALSVGDFVDICHRVIIVCHSRVISIIMAVMMPVAA